MSIIKSILFCGVLDFEGSRSCLLEEGNGYVLFVIANCVFDLVVDFCFIFR